MLSFNDVNVQFQTRKRRIHAVINANLHVGRGEIFGIMGKSGAGKSTLLRTVNRLERPSSGQVLVGGRDIARLSKKELRKAREKIGMVFQHFNLINSLTVHDNIVLPLLAAGVAPAEIRRRVTELLQLVGLPEKEFASPAQLSGGQKQRVGIARALANHPDVILGDEPTSALDLETTESILDLLYDINSRLGVTILLITHEIQVVKKICHRAAVMQAGEIVEVNSTYELFANPQHPQTREFVDKSINIELPEHVLRQNKGTIVRIVYQGDRASEPVLADTLLQHQIHFNILHGRIEYINNKPIGELIVALDGISSEIEAALRQLRAQVARLEVISNG